MDPDTTKETDIGEAQSKVTQCSAVMKLPSRLSNTFHFKYVQER